MPATTIHVIGASGRSGATLCRALLARGGTPVPIVRNPARWAENHLPLPPRIADLNAPAALCAALADAEIIVSCAHARHAPAILAASPAGARFVLLGSTRKFTRFPDDHGQGVLAGEAAFLASGRPGIILHPTMIYGAQGEDNVQRLAALLRHLPIVPLPGGGTSLVQPIYQGDVIACILAALREDWTTPQTLVIAGPQAMPYADFVREIARAARLAPPRILKVPAKAMQAAAWLTRLPGLPTIRAAEIRRLLEDKAFSTTDMQSKLGVVPVPLAQGLAFTFARSEAI